MIIIGAKIQNSELKNDASYRWRHKMLVKIEKHTFSKIKETTKGGGDISYHIDKMVFTNIQEPKMKMIYGNWYRYWYHLREASS